MSHRNAQLTNYGKTLPFNRSKSLGFRENPNY